MNVSDRPTVFISYSHKDEDWKNRVVSHLGVAQHQNLLYAWEDRQIGGGEDWDEKIQDAMNAASVAILLVSANSLTSNYILHHEVEHLLERRDTEGLRIFPIIIKPCDWEAVPWLKRMNLRPRDGRPLSGESEHDIDVALAKISKEVRESLRETKRTTHSTEFVSHDPEKVSTSRLPITGRELFGREVELAQLDDAWFDRNVNVISLVAWGGVGKSALVNHWLRRLAEDHYRGAEHVYGWSFYSQGTTDSAVSADIFIGSALRWFGDKDPGLGTAWEKGERLARLIGAQRTLLILDGLEPLQYPPGSRGGRLKEPSLQALLRELAVSNPGLCVISTRLAVTELNEFEDRTARKIDLDHLSTEAGAELLKAQGVVGDDAELGRAADEFGGHSLALTLLGGYLSDVHGGDVRRRDRVISLEEDVRHGRHAERVMASYEAWFGEGPELDALRLLGLFNRPADPDSIAVLRAAPPISGLTDSLQRLSEEDWQRALSKLRRAKLLAAPNPSQPGTLDTHPLVREHFGQQIKRTCPEAWREGNYRLYEHLTFAAEEYTDTIDEMAALVAAVPHGFEAGRSQEALETLTAYFLNRRPDAFAREPTPLRAPAPIKPVAAANNATDSADRQVVSSHPKGLYVLFFAEMFERFSFYSMLALFALYMRNPEQGFGWTAADATSLYAWYLTFVYASPLVGGIVADWKLGYRRAIMIGGLFFVVGHGLLSFRSLTAVYAALACLVIGNGFFKPNVSTMVGNLYPEGSHLKDRAYSIFYMGINVGVVFAPIVMEIVRQQVGYQPAFAVAALGMIISVGILWWFRNRFEKTLPMRVKKMSARQVAEGDATGVDVPTRRISHQNPIDAVPEWKRISALIVIFVIAIVFWMVFHQNGSTLTYWADDNTAWSFSGTISNAINPIWIIVLTFPLVWLWGWLDRRGKEPATPTKMVLGMFLTALSFSILFVAARVGEGSGVQPGGYASGSFRVTERAINNLRVQGLPEEVLKKLSAGPLPDDLIARLESESISEELLTKLKTEIVSRKTIVGRKFSEDDGLTGEQNFITALSAVLGPEDTQKYKDQIMSESYLFRVSPVWLVLAYMVISLAELLLSPMGLSLVSKVAPIRMRGMMMGGWFLATAIGSRLTAIGIFWERWLQSEFFMILGTMALIMAFVLLVLLRPLKKAMPGV